MNLKVINGILVILGVALFALAPAQCQPTEYIIGTVAGGGLPQTPLLASSASLRPPAAVASDADGIVFFVSDHCVYKRDSGGLLTRVVGSSAFPGYSGDGGPATNAQLWAPSGLAVDSSGNIYIADTRNHRIRKVTKTSGIITTVAGNGIPGMVIDGGPAIFASVRFSFRNCGRFLRQPLHHGCR